MQELGSVLDIAIILLAALIGGLIAHRLRQPLILGYLIAGSVIGPYGFKLIEDPELVKALALLGVVLLMFTIGLEMSLSSLRQAGKVGFWGGIIQIALTAGIGLLLSKIIFNWPLTQAALFGLIVSLSSTMVVLKILMERGELDSVHGRIMLAILILQDLSVVLMIIAIPLLGGTGENFLQTLGLVTIKAVLFLGLAFALGVWGFPWLLSHVAGVRSRELFLLTVLLLCLGAAFATFIFGFSVALGAFFIGLLIRESKFSRQALSEITPLRDIFATLFFVSLGMLFNPSFIWENWSVLILVLLLILGGKFIISFLIVRLFGYSLPTALLVAAGLLQIGEFGFVLAQAGLETGIISQYFYSLILASTIITMLVTPLTLSATAWLYPKLSQLSLGGKPILKDAPLLTEEKHEHLSNHIVIAGHGRIGRNIVKALRQLGIPYLILETDPKTITELRCGNNLCIYGDASNEHILSQAALKRARLLVITFPDPLAAITTAKNALRINPNLKIIARVHRKSEVDTLKRLNITELINPEFEASEEFIRRTLASFNWDKTTIERTIDTLKEQKDLLPLVEKDED